MQQTPKPAALIGRMGSHLAISLGIALAIAGVINLPSSLGSRPEAAVPSARVGWLAQAPLDGKFGDRLGLAASQDRADGMMFTPAVLAMPMRADWPQSQAARTPETASQAPQSLAPIRLRTAALAVTALPPRRDPGLAEGRVGAAPLQVLPTVAWPTPERQEQGGWTRWVAEPALTVAGAVSGTAQAAQAAGAWTLTQAGGLLPRW